MQNVGLPELIAESPDEYVDLAVRLSSDIARLQMLRGGLRAQMLASPLMDAMEFTRAVEVSYREMWKSWCSGRSQH